jgi:hypothetical protein
LETDTPYTIELSPLEGRDETRNTLEIQGPSLSSLEGIYVRSCDNAGLSFRSRSIETLLKQKPKALITLGDMIYADIYRPSLTGTAYETYYQVWCQTLAPLLPITSQCANLFIADDHEIQDNVDMKHLKHDETIGFHLVTDIYQALAQLVRQGGPYDNYLLPQFEENTQFVFYGHSDKSFIQETVDRMRVESTQRTTKLIVLSNKPYILTQPSWMSRLYYNCTDCKRTQGDVDTELFRLLAQYPNVFLIGGDYHRSLTGTHLGVEVRVTSPFSGIQFWGQEEYLIDRNVTDSELASNFYNLATDEHILIETSMWERWWNGLLIAKYRLC